MMPGTQNNATNSYYFGTNVNNNNKTNSNLAIPFFDYHNDDNGFWVCVSLIF